VISLFGRVHSAAALLTAAHSSRTTCFFASASHSSFCIRIGSEMWSEYFEMIERSFQPETNSSSPSRKWRMTLVPRSARVIGSTSNAPAPSDVQRTPWSAARPARRDSTVTRSATMNAE
jgi:hypothetical protein